MTFLNILITIFEIGMVSALFWCFFHEDRLIAFEKKLAASRRRRKLHVVQSQKTYTAIKVHNN